MASTSTDAIDGVSTSANWKLVRGICTSNITLSGLSAITTVEGSMTPADGDRFLLAGQTDATTRLIYEAHSGAWTIAPDSDGSRDLRDGTAVKTQGGVMYHLTTSDPIEPGTTSLTWERIATSLLGDGSVVTVESFEDLREITGMVDGQVVRVRHYYPLADVPAGGGGGDVEWKSTSEATVDNGIVFLPTGHSGAGRWVRVYSGALNVKWFGAKGDGSTNDATAFQAALDLAGAGVTVSIPYSASSYMIGTALVPLNYTIIRGDGWSTILRPTSAPASLFDLSGKRGVKICDLQLATTQTTTPYRHILLGPGAYFNEIDHVWGNANGVKTAGQSMLALTSDGSDGSYWNIIKGLLASGIHTGVDASSTGGEGQNANRFVACRIDDVVDGIVLGGATGNGADYNILDGVTIGSFTTDGIRVGAQSHFNIGAGLVFEGSTGSTVIRCAGTDNRFELVHASPTGTDTITDTGTRNSFREVSRSNLFTGVTGGSWRINETVSIPALLVATLSNAGFKLDVSGASRLAGDVTVAGSVASTGGMTSSHSAAGIGYATGAGGTVTQATDKATGVTLNKATGQITMNAAALAANTSVSFTLTSSAVAATDFVLVQHVSGGTVGAYTAVAAAASGSASITVRNITAGSLSEAIVLKYVVIKAVTS